MEKITPEKRICLSGVNCFGYALLKSYKLKPELGSSTDLNVLRVRMETVMKDEVISYHVIYQLSNGSWAGKNDIFKSKKLDTGNPSTTPDMWEGFTGETIYYAIIPKK